jgi:hypothetical protein
MMKMSMMKILRSLERGMMYGVETAIRKGHNTRSCTQPNNPNRNIWLKNVKKTKPNIGTEVTFYIIY